MRHSSNVRRVRPSKPRRLDPKRSPQAKARSIELRAIRSNRQSH